ncbi:hypothetical protein R1sor_026865 [Riccia sorocarpa]|uniref:Uncharacterized protein n=1 Tax=Riccia sorocarpa TaxID=122646 RepID=A0ABD3GEC8_9MARC
MCLYCTDVGEWRLRRLNSRWLWRMQAPRTAYGQFCGLYHPLKKKSKAPTSGSLEEAVKMATIGAANNGGTSSPSGAGANSGRTAPTLGEIIFSNPFFQKSASGSDDGETGAGTNGHIQGGDAVGNTAEDFPPLCKTVEAVVPEPAEEQHRTTIQRPQGSWKQVTAKSILERHPQWTNAKNILEEPNPYLKGLKATEGENG